MAVREGVIGFDDAPLWMSGDNGWSADQKDAAYIAAANPATMLELLDEFERCRAEVESLESKNAAGEAWVVSWTYANGLPEENA